MTVGPGNEGAWYLNMAFRLRLSQLGMRIPPEVAGARVSFVIGYYIEHYIEANVIITFFLSWYVARYQAAALPGPASVGDLQVY